MSPDPAQIRAAREAAQQTQAEAASVVSAGSRRTWQDWEAGARSMPPAAWELYLLRTGQHPTHEIAPRT